MAYRGEAGDPPRFFGWVSGTEGDDVSRALHSAGFGRGALRCSTQETRDVAVDAYLRASQPRHSGLV